MQSFSLHFGKLPGKFHGQRRLVGYSPWGPKESDTTERLHFLSVSLSLSFSFFQKVEQFVYGTYLVGCFWKDVLKSLLLKAVFHVEVLANWKHL